MSVPANARGSHAFRCGYISIVGRPNAGKSTLLNCLIGQKISITSRKPQTTRWQLTGIRSERDFQAIYIDTPGIQSEYDLAVHRHMNREAISSLNHVDVIVLVAEAMKWSDADNRILQLANETGLPVVIVISKIDRIKTREKLLPFIKKLSEAGGICEIIPVSVKKRENIDRLEQCLYSLLPVSPPVFPDNQVSNRNERFFAAEFIREKLIQKLGDELPYRIAVTIAEFSEKENIIFIDGVVWVENKSQQKIVIGKKGEVMKAVGESARKDMETMFEKKVYLQNRVRVKKNWTSSIEAMKQLGFQDQ